MAAKKKIVKPVKKRQQINIMPLAVRRLKPFERWHRVGFLVRLIVVSSRVANIEAPLNLILAGPPGDGKTRMLFRVEDVPHVQMLSDTTYTGVCYFLEAVRDRLSSALVIPDLATIIGRRTEVAKQTIATLAMMCAEGVKTVRVGKQVRDYAGAQASILTAITFDDINANFQVLNQNAFFSRVFLIDFDLEWHELVAMMDKKTAGDRSLLKALDFSTVRRNRDGTMKVRDIILPRGYALQAKQWWMTLRRHRRDRFFGFRSADAFHGLLMASAYLRGARAVTRTDVRLVKDDILPLIEGQVELVKPGG